MSKRIASPGQHAEWEAELPALYKAYKKTITKDETDDDAIDKAFDAYNGVQECILRTPAPDLEALAVQARTLKRFYKECGDAMPCAGENFLTALPGTIQMMQDTLSPRHLKKAA